MRFHPRWRVYKPSQVFGALFDMLISRAVCHCVLSLFRIGVVVFIEFAQCIDDRRRPLRGRGAVKVYVAMPRR